MYYIIQENLFREHHFNTLIEYLKKYNLEYEIIKFRPFTEDLEFKTTRKDVFCFGSVNLAAIAKKYDWNPGSLYNENHDFTVYGPKYGINMLNSDGLVMNVGDTLPDKYKMFFARPTKDTKSFSGQVFTRSAWEDWVKDLDNSSLKQRLTAETQVLIAPLKTIQQEIRCWIVNGKPVTISQYKIGSRVNMLNMDNNQEAVIFATDMAKLYNPARAYVMDICLFEDEYKIVEINCINCSGFYDLNMSKLLQALEQTFKN